LVSWTARATFDAAMLVGQALGVVVGPELGAGSAPEGPATGRALQGDATDPAASAEMGAWVGGTRPGDDGFWLAGPSKSRRGYDSESESKHGIVSVQSKDDSILQNALARRMRLGAGGAILSTYVLESKYAFVDVKGKFGDNLPGFQALNISTLDGGIRAAQIMGAVTVDDYMGENTLVLKSTNGRIQLLRAVLPGIIIRSGGPISCSSAISGSVDILSGDPSLPITVTGILDVVGSGDGERVVMTRAMAGYDISIRSAGDLIVSNSAAGPAIGLSLSARDSMVLSSLLMASGNQTSLEVDGKSLSGSALFSNRVKVNAGSATLSIAEAFIGVATPTGNLAGNFKPRIQGFNYSIPAVDMSTRRGKISLIGLGAAPADADLHFASNMQVDLVTRKGSIKVEVNGGGYIGNYTTQSSGRVTVEIEEQSAGRTGVIGDVPTDVPVLGRLHIESTQGGSIDLAVLDSAF